MAVTEDGTVFTNVEWDEGGGQVGEYRDGELIRYARHTHGWGANGGVAIAANSKYVFIGMVMGNEGGGLKDEKTWPPKGSKWYGVSRRLRSDISKAAPFPSGKGGKGDTLKESFLVVSEVPEKEGAPIAGMCADEKRLYVADPNSWRIWVYECETLQLIDNWRIMQAGPLAMDRSGAVWLLTRLEGMQPHFRRFAPDGMTLGSLVLQDCTAPTSFCLSREGKAYVFDDGPDQQVRVYDVSKYMRKDDDNAARPATSMASIGLKGGIHSGVPGAFGDGKFNRVMAMGCDNLGNIYLAQDGQTGGGGTVLESRGLSSAKTNWRLFGLTFVDMADVDPQNDTDAFTKEEHFKLDYSKEPGAEWSFTGYTVNRFRYPQDPRLHIWSAGAWVRTIGGSRILFVSDMNGDELQVYRFSKETDGEIAIPSAFFAKRRITDKKDPSWPPNQPERGEWIWRDVNGNGAFDSGEYAQPSAIADAPNSQGWWVDETGGVWLATETKGIRYWPAAGLDPKGNPIWKYDSMQSFPPLPEFKQVKRLRYNPATDTLFAAGTTEEHKNQHWKPSGAVLACYDGWLRGTRKLRWKVVMPYVAGSQGHSSCEPMGFDVAGDFLFVPYTGASKADSVKHGRVELFRVSDGSAAGHVEPSDDVGEIGLQDIRECLRAWRRTNGEYIVLLEDDYKSKVVMYRLTLR